MRQLSLLLAICCVSSPVFAQYWDGPYQLSADQSDDINPSACKEFLAGDRTCLVWQRLTAESWNIHSRFGRLYDGSAWSSEMAVTRDSVYGNVNPAVACLKDSSFWCVWEHRVSFLVGSIRASFVTVGDSWSTPVELGPVIHTEGDSAMPGVITVNGTSADTVWVAWRNHDTSGTYIRYVYHAGDSWSAPEIAVVADLKHARLGRVIEQGNAKPILVWEQTGDIWYSIRDSSGWTSPAEVAPSDSEDRNPDVVSNGGFLDWLGTYVVWESTRDGDTAVYITAPDSFSIGQRVCEGSGAGRNFNPAGADVAFTALDYWYCIVAWVSDRNGNPDIYTSQLAVGDVWVDLHLADDLAPVVSCMGDWGSQMVWVLWQSNRNGNWDIYGSFLYNSGIEESHKPQASSRRPAATVLSGASGVGRLASCVVFDAMGRRVVNPRSGVFFVAESGARSAVHVHKVVIQR